MANFPASKLPSGAHSHATLVDCTAARPGSLA
jgi:hypothetical protein